MKTSRQSTKERSAQPASDRAELLQGTLDMLILRTLLWGPVHGHGIATSIQRVSQDMLTIEHGSLYPALQRLLQKGWIAGEWGTSENNRRAKFYRLTPAGRKQLTAESSKWERLVKAVGRVLDPARGRP
ncbi:MAG TPA: PadR family transcriptional regulator [Candidatus Angelobacter sp.]|nr:PadR family transcriptional regulator [Candidatus Angelobacter sp.]